MRAKASELGLAARFEVADALDLGLTVETVIDSGVFHVFGDDDRARCVASLAAVLSERLINPGRGLRVADRVEDSSQRSDDPEQSALANYVCSLSQLEK